MNITNTQIEKIFRKAIRNTRSKKYYLKGEDGQWLCCYCEGQKFPEFSGRREEFIHFLNCVKKAREKGFKFKDYSEAEYLFGMLISHKVYSGINKKTILEDEYIKKYDIDDDIKLFFADYVDKCIINIRYAGTDGEGCEYNTCDYAEIL